MTLEHVPEAHLDCVSFLLVFHPSRRTRDMRFQVEQGWVCNNADAKSAFQGHAKEPARKYIEVKTTSHDGDLAAFPMSLQELRFAL